MKRYLRGVSLAGFYVTPDVLWIGSAAAILIGGALLSRGVNPEAMPISYKV